FGRAFGEPRLGVDDPRSEHHTLPELRAQVARGRDRLLPASAVGGEEPDLPAARGLRFDDAERAARHVAEVVALLERPAQRAEERRALPRRRKDRAVDAQGRRALAYETEVEPQRGEAVGREQRLDLVDGAAEREDELLARADGVVPHATDEDPPRRRTAPREVAGERAGREHSDPRQCAAQRGEEPFVERRARVARDDGERDRTRHEAAASASPARLPRSVAAAPSAGTAKSARLSRGLCPLGPPTSNVQPTVRSNRRSQDTRSNVQVGMATRRPRSSLTTRSAAGR